MGKPQYHQKFVLAWLNDARFKIWLEEKTYDGTSWAFCKYCHEKLNPKKSNLERHMKTANHLRNCKVSNSHKPINEFIPNINLNVAKEEARFSLYTAVHTSIRSVDHLCKMYKRVNPQFRLGRTKCSKIICNVLKPYFEEALFQDIDNTPFSLLLDESTDNSNIQYLGVAIIYYSRLAKDIIYTFLTLYPLQSSHAKSIVEALKKILKFYDLKFEQLIAIGTDNASVMTGSIGGVYAMLKELNPNLILIRCMNHSLQLAVSAACNLTIPKDVEFLLSETYKWFSHSPKREAQYKTLYESLHHEVPLKIINMSGTRWLSIQGCVSRVLAQWDDLKALFQQAKTTENCYMASVLYRMYCSTAIKLYLLFLQPVLIQLNSLNKILQSNKCIPVKILTEITSMMKSWITIITLPHRNILMKDLFNTPLQDIKRILNNQPYLGFQFESLFTLFDPSLENPAINFEEAQKMKDEMKIRCRDFLVHLIGEFQSRLPTNVTLLMNLELLAPSKVLRQIRTNWTPLFDLLNKSALDRTLIENELNEIAILQWTNKNDTQILDFWVEVMNYEDCAGSKRFENVATFALSLLIIPHSNAEVERIFSLMNLLKTKLRNKFQIYCLSALMTIRFGLKRMKKCCWNIPIENIPVKYLRDIASGEAWKNKIDVYYEEPDQVPLAVETNEDDLEYDELDSMYDMVTLHIEVPECEADL